MTNVTGSHFRAVDLHIHTPASHDFEDRRATPDDIVAAALAKGLELIAITDHNSGEWVERVAKAAKGKSLTVLPGVEVTTPEGHILGIFDSAFTAADIADLLISVGISRDKHGREEAISEKHAEEVITLISSKGGVAIAAHANSKGIGLLQHKGQYKITVVRLAELAALEFVQRDDIEKFSAGRVSPDYPPKACTQSSDAHSLEDIGKRVCYLKMHDLSANGIRQALGDHDLRVRFPWNHAQASHPRILSLRVSQGFFAGQQFMFHQNLNCLVGGQGAGKSTVIELLRFCVADRSTFDHIVDDHEGKLSLLLGIGGTVEVQYLDSDGIVKTVRRELHEWESDREVRDSEGNASEILTAPAFFSQGELVDVARSPFAQLELLDRRLDLDDINRKEADYLGRLQQTAAALTADHAKIESIEADLHNAETGLLATRAKHESLSKTLSDPVLKTFPRWEAEQEYLGTITSTLASLPDTFDELIESFPLDDLDLDQPDDTPNAKEIKPLAQTSADVVKLLDRARSEFRKGIVARQSTAKPIVDAIEVLFQAQRKKYGEILRSLSQADVNKATSQLRALSVRIDTLTKQDAELAKVRKRIEKNSAERDVLVDKLRSVRAERAKLRKTKAVDYQELLAGVVEIDLAPSADRAHFAECLRSLSKGAMIREPDLLRIVDAIDPSSLCALILAEDTSAIAAASGVTTEVATRLVSRCLEKGRAKVYELDIVSLADRPQFRYVVSEGRSKPLSELSTGQKGTVIIALALVEGDGPLIVDHPEEPLDTKSIYGQVVDKLRRGKEQRQFIVTTHNANIAVGADAELSHVLGATADRGTIEGSGGIDDRATNALLLLHLEGGADALARRIRKYHQPKSTA